MVRSNCSTTGRAGNSSADDSGSSAAAALGATAAQGSSSSYTAKAVACRFRAELQQQLQREWDRVEVDLRVGSGIPLAWLGGRSPVICWRDFKQKWAGLYRRSRWGDDGRLVVIVSTVGL